MVETWVGLCEKKYAEAPGNVAIVELGTFLSGLPVTGGGLLAFDTHEMLELVMTELKARNFEVGSHIGRAPLSMALSTTLLVGKEKQQQAA